MEPTHFPTPPAESLSTVYESLSSTPKGGQEAADGLGAVGLSEGRSGGFPEFSVCLVYLGPAAGEAENPDAPGHTEKDAPGNAVFLARGPQTEQLARWRTQTATTARPQTPRGARGRGGWARDGPGFPTRQAVRTGPRAWPRLTSALGGREPPPRVGGGGPGGSLRFCPRPALSRRPPVSSLGERRGLARSRNCHLQQWHRGPAVSAGGVTDPPPRPTRRC